MKMLYATALTRGLKERDMADKRGLQKRKRDRSSNTEPPRTRDGKNFPGGRELRRRLKTLSARQTAFEAKADRTKPGSMRG